MSQQALILQQDVSIVNADVKKLPSVPYLIVEAPGSGFRIKPLGWTIFTKFSAGAYSGLDTTYATLQLINGSGDWLSDPVGNDSGVSLIDLTTMFGAHDRTFDLSATGLFPINGAGGWIAFNTTLATANVDNSVVYLGMDNNGSMTDLGGGNAANAMRVRLYYTVETTAI